MERVGRIGVLSKALTEIEQKNKYNFNIRITFTNVWMKVFLRLDFER
jgi:hypothetical protein